jgi:hypothetical protein
MKLNEINSVAVNEHGTNLIKSKHDPLVVIEAKTAMSKGEQMVEKDHNSESGVLLEKVEEKGSSKPQNKNMQEEIATDEGGTQEAPEVEAFSQEENPLNQKSQDVAG